MQHGLTREVFLGELAPETMSFLRGETDELNYYSNSIEQTSQYWMKRWVSTREQLKDKITDFDPDSIRISKEIGLERDLTIF
jgi:hypothetical protein